METRGHQDIERVDSRLREITRMNSILSATVPFTLAWVLPLGGKGLGAYTTEAFDIGIDPIQIHVVMLAYLITASIGILVLNLEFNFILAEGWSHSMMSWLRLRSFERSIVITYAVLSGWVVGSLAFNMDQEAQGDVSAGGGLIGLLTYGIMVFCAFALLLLSGYYGIRLWRAFATRRRPGHIMRRFSIKPSELHGRIKVLLRDLNVIHHKPVTRGRWVIMRSEEGVDVRIDIGSGMVRIGEMSGHNSVYVRWLAGMIDEVVLARDSNSAGGPTQDDRKSMIPLFFRG